MKVKEFVSRLWYSQDLVIIKWRDFDKCKDFDEILDKSLAVCDNADLRSAEYKWIMEMDIDSYGVYDGMLIVEVHE